MYRIARALFRTAVIAALVYLLLLAVGTIGSGFKMASGGTEGARALFEFAQNPFIGLLVGCLATALVQSSSTVTSVIVGLVAGGLPVSLAIPMVMGANIGTTITNTIVSLAHSPKEDGFRRAFAAATVHDIFNVMAVFIFLPLEIIFGFLEKISSHLVSWVDTGASLSLKEYNFIKPITKPLIKEFSAALDSLGNISAGAVMVIVGIAVIFLSITIMGKVLKNMMQGSAKNVLQSAVGKNPVAGIGAGAVVTVLVQSSSTTTSMIVPFAGHGVFNLRQIYPFTLGANIGTTITAFLAATSLSGDGAQVALQIALVHVVYNLLAVLVIFGLPWLRPLPPRGAEWLADIAANRRWLAVVYLLVFFFMIPALAVLITRAVTG